MSSTAEVVKKKGRPRKTATVGTITLVEDSESVLVKVKKPRLSRKSTLTSTSPNDDSKDFASTRARKKDELLSSASKAVKEPKTRPMRSVAAETALLAQQLKSPSTRPESFLILKQATAFVGDRKDEASQKPSESLKANPLAFPKNFRSAGTLPDINALEDTKPVLSTTLSSGKTSLFLADFFTQPPLAEQPAWSRPKKPAAAPKSASVPPEVVTGIESAAPQRSDTSTLLSTSPSSSNSPLFQPSPVTQALQTSISKAETRPQILPKPSTQPEHQSVQAATSAQATASTSSQAKMSRKSPTEASTPIPPRKALFQSPTRSGPTPNLPPRIAAAPTPLKPTEMAYEDLKRDPKFRALSRRYTALIVSIPILLATSYALYGRYTETTVQRKRVLDQGTSTINGGV